MTSTTTRRILLAEDDDELRTALTTLLERDGYLVTSVASGGALMTALRMLDGPPAAVISDERMPGLRGLSVLRYARDEGLAPSLILITAFDDDAVLVEADHIGAALLTKPFEVDDLRGLLGERELTCAACRSGKNLRAVVSEGGVLFCGECRSLFRLSPDDPTIDVGGGD